MSFAESWICRTTGITAGDSRGDRFWDAGFRRRRGRQCSSVVNTAPPGAPLPAAASPLGRTAAASVSRSGQRPGCLGPRGPRFPRPPPSATSERSRRFARQGARSPHCHDGHDAIGNGCLTPPPVRNCAQDRSRPRLRDLLGTFSGERALFTREEEKQRGEQGARTTPARLGSRNDHRRRNQIENSARRAPR